MWVNLTTEQKIQILEQTGVAKGLPSFVVEKDWWVCIILRAIFQSQHAFEVKVVLPTRTFIEKALLLHEEFSKPVDKIRVDRLTRHLYDLDKIMQSMYGKQAIEDEELFDMIVEHREKITPLRGMDYSNHKKGNLKILPLAEVMDKRAADYKIMKENMIVGDSLKWEKLLAEIQTIEDAFNKK